MLNIDKVPHRRLSNPEKNTETIISMFAQNRLKIIGERIQKARLKRGLKQGQLGQALWPEKTHSAAQTRIYRIENALSPLDYDTAHRLFEFLEIFDIDARTLEDKEESKALCFDASLGVRFPELHGYIRLINSAAINARFDEVVRLVEALPHMIKGRLPLNESEKQQNGDDVSAPFPEGGQEKR